jgi:mono/diheme cytochrome c family protein
MHARRTLTLLALLAAVPAAAWGQDLPGDAKAGRALAERQCSSCHRIGAGEATPPDARAPSFQAVADTEGMGPMAVYVWLHSPHETMPHIRLRQKEAEDVAAYISGLRGAESR